MGDILRELRLQKGATQEEVGQVIGVGKAAIQKYEKGIVSNMKRSSIQKLSEYFGVSPVYLMGFTAENAGLTPYNPPMKRIPILGAIAAGLPIYAEENIEGYTYTELNHGGEYFALRVKGDSMNAAQINDGNLLIVRRQPEVENGEIAVVIVDHENATVKRFKRQGDIVQLIPQSYNPEHQAQIYDLKTTSITVIGKVMECKIIF